GLGLPPPCLGARGAPRVKPCAPEWGVCRGDLGSLGRRRGPRRTTLHGSSSGGQPPLDRAALLVPSGKGATRDPRALTPISTGRPLWSLSGRVPRVTTAAALPCPKGGCHGCLQGLVPQRAGLMVSTRARTARLIASGRSGQAATSRLATARTGPRTEERRGLL